MREDSRTSHHIKRHMRGEEDSCTLGRNRAAQLTVHDAKSDSPGKLRERTARKSVPLDDSDIPLLAHDAAAAAAATGTAELAAPHVT